MPCNSPHHCPSVVAAAERKWAEDAVAAGSLPEEDIPEEDSPGGDSHPEADNHPGEEVVDSSPAAVGVS